MVWLRGRKSSEAMLSSWPSPLMTAGASDCRLKEGQLEAEAGSRETAAIPTTVGRRPHYMVGSDVHGQRKCRALPFTGLLEELAQLGSSSLEEARGAAADGAPEPGQPRSAPADSSSASGWVR
ncbi:hypothetical protein EYF80_031420 [Liparis tanakae]|uniref:Uncharacterized protein n=1 Tax=Liparis tanakae TaxID=230148 RepID=A0A4Z2GXI2_9TELE|nr:hypothetical protein EYF80_031420 [Liparis tanakae]